MLELRRYQTPLGADLLQSAVRDPGSVPSEPLAVKVDWTETNTALEAIAAKGDFGTALDATLAPHLYRALRGLPARLLSDTGFWTWLAVSRMSGFVKQRWFSLPVGDPLPAELTDAEQKHFVLRSPTLNSMSRHAGARLFWAAHLVTGDNEPDDDLIKRCFYRSDLYSGLFERRAGNSPQLLRAVLEHLPEEPEKTVRRPAMRLINLRLGTTRIEFASDEQAADLVKAVVDEVKARGTDD